MHRDLKPENLLFLTRDDLNSLKIADFGLAQSIDDHPYIYPKYKNNKYSDAEHQDLWLQKY